MLSNHILTFLDKFKVHSSLHTAMTIRSVSGNLSMNVSRSYDEVYVSKSTECSILPPF